MQLKTKLKFIGVLPLLMAVIFGVTAYHGHHHLRELRDLTTIADGMLDQIEQLEAAMQRFLETRSHSQRYKIYLLTDSLNIQIYLTGQRFASAAPPEIVDELRRHVWQLQGLILELDARYLPTLTAPEISQIQALAQRLQIEISQIQPRLHRLHYLGHLQTTLFSDQLWQTEFLLIIAAAILSLALMVPVLWRIATALHVLRIGTLAQGTEHYFSPLRLAGNDEFNQLANEFNQMAQRLAHAEHERSIHLSELENAVQDLENFSYSVSHDLRAPLRAIDGFVAILMEEYAPVLDTEGLRLFAVVSNNAKKMEQLINDILALSRAGRLELELKPIDMNALVREVWEQLMERHPERVVEFDCAELPPIHGDARALRQVWQNLLDNALKFTAGRESAHIQVSAAPRGDMLRYCVSDNGVGFDPAYQNKLFGLFLRLHGMEEFEGTGVGLAIVKRFVQKHQGTVEGTGAVGAGATFCFHLPITTSSLPFMQPFVESNA